MKKEIIKNKDSIIKSRILSISFRFLKEKHIYKQWKHNYYFYHWGHYDGINDIVNTMVEYYIHDDQLHGFIDKSFEYSKASEGISFWWNKDYELNSLFEHLKNKIFINE